MQKNAPDLNEALTQVLTSISRSAENEATELLKAELSLEEITQYLGLLRRYELTKFEYSSKKISRQLTDALVVTAFPQNFKLQFLALNSKFVKNQFKALFEEFEGSACSTDKANAVMHRIASYLDTGVFTPFDSTAKYTFHHPIKVCREQKQAVDFFEAVYLLYYGKPKNYMEFMAMLYK